MSNYQCKQFGHFKNKCPNRYETNEPSNRDRSNEPNCVNAFSVVFLNGQFSKEDWYIDSGASVHLTVLRHNMENISVPTKIKEIMIAKNRNTCEMYR